jgi:hypothetical protein
MPAKPSPGAQSGRDRAPKGKKQMLVILDQDIIKAVKVAAAEDETKVSHIVEQQLREWLEARKLEHSSK